MASQQQVLKEAKRRLQIAQALHEFVQRTKGGPAGGKPMAAAAAGVRGQAMAAEGVPVAPHVRSHPQRSDAALQARALRQQQAEAAGIVRPGETFRAYGPHANPRAAEILQGGSGMTAGLGAAQARPGPDLAEALARRLKPRRRGGRMAPGGGSG